MEKIKFSHQYEKLPGSLPFNAILLEVFVEDREGLSPSFVGYDTIYDIDGIPRFYPLPKGKLLVLLFQANKGLFTTIRSWTPNKEVYYLALRGQVLNCVRTK